jgi:Raf kinase inhibitor-like YbhB/YbcL family protein
MKVRLPTAVLFSALLLTACGAPNLTGQPASAETGAPPESLEGAMSFELTSTAFSQGEPIPARYSCDGEDISPPLTWSDPPEGTQSFALIMDDPDAPVGTWDHWILFNIPVGRRELPENAPLEAKNQDPDAIFVGRNSWGRADYGGPCPPSGTHRSFFKLYALNTTLGLLSGANKGELLKGMEGYILAQTELMGTYTR